MRREITGKCQRHELELVGLKEKAKIGEWKKRFDLSLGGSGNIERSWSSTTVRNGFQDTGGTGGTITDPEWRLQKQSQALDYNLNSNEIKQHIFLFTWWKRKWEEAQSYLTPSLLHKVPNQLLNFLYVKKKIIYLYVKRKQTFPSPGKMFNLLNTQDKCSEYEIVWLQHRERFFRGGSSLFLLFLPAPSSLLSLNEHKKNDIWHPEE